MPFFNATPSKLWLLVTAGTMALAVAETRASASPAPSLADRFAELQLSEAAANEELARRSLDVLRRQGTVSDRLASVIDLGVHYLDRDPRTAMQFFTQARTLVGPTEPMARVIDYYLASAKHKAGFAAAAAADFKLLVAEKGLGSDLERAGTLKLLQALRDAAAPKVFIEIFEDALERYGANRLSHGDLRYAAEIYADLGLAKRELPLVELLAKQHPITPEARWALALLKSRQRDGHYAFSLDFLQQLGRNEALDPELRPWIRSVVDEAWQAAYARVQAPEAILRLKALFHVRDYEAAVAEADQIASASDLKPLDRARALLFLARSYDRLENHEKALEVYEDLLVRAPNFAQQTDVQIGLASMLSYVGKYDRAARVYGELASAHPTTHLRWHHFWNHYLAGNSNEALELAGAGGSRLEAQDEREPTGNLYWYGRLLRREGQLEEAERVFRKVRERDPESFYALMTEAKGKETAEDAFHAFLLASRSPANFQAAPALAPLATLSLAALPLIALPAESDGAGADKVSRIAALGADSAESAKLKSAFPVVFDNVLDPVTRSAEVDKYLVLAIMRAESNFIAHARSHVGASGLMQVMPYTAAQIAKLVDDPSFTLDRMTDPTFSITYGAFYLRHLLTYYGNNPYLAVAAYNAGPAAVNAWLGGARGQSIDEFVESIPYKETRHYVKKVMRFFVQYHRLYEDAAFKLPFSPLPGSLPDDMTIF